MLKKLFSKSKKLSEKSDQRKSYTKISINFAYINRFKKWKTGKGVLTIFHDSMQTYEIGSREYNVFLKHELDTKVKQMPDAVFELLDPHYKVVGVVDDILSNHFISEEESFSRTRLKLLKLDFVSNGKKGTTLSCNVCVMKF